MPCKNYPNRAAWLADRAKPARDGHAMIGASDIAAIFGLGFVSPARFAAQKRGTIPRDAEPTSPDDPRAVGNRLEAAALAEYELRHSSTPGCLDDEITRWTHPEIPWLAVSPDALVYALPSVDHTDGDIVGLVQCKIPRMVSDLRDYAPDRPDGYGLAETLADPRGPAVPRDYALQCLAELGTVRACGEPAAWIDLWCWPSPHAHRRVRLTWDAGAQAAYDSLITAVGQWRQRHIVDGEPVPIGDPDDATVAVRLWAREGQHTAPGLARLARAYEDARSRATLIEASMDATKAALLAAMDKAGASVVIIPDPSADPTARKKADREGKPAKIAITGKPGGTRSLRITPGWLDQADPATLPPADTITPPEPLTVPGVTVGQLAARWADREDTGALIDPVLPAEDAALLADLLAGS